MPPPTQPKFVDFDQPSSFHLLEAWSLSFSSLNFVLDFSNTTALCARDLTASQMSHVLHSRTAARSPSPQSPPISLETAALADATRWINIWKPETQPKLLRRVGRHYGFSARLLASMCCPQAPWKPHDGQQVHEHQGLSAYIDGLIQPWRSRGRRVVAAGKRGIEQQRAQGRMPGPKQAAAVAKRISQADSVAAGAEGTPGDELGGAADVPLTPYPTKRTQTGASTATGGGGGATGLDLDFYRLVNDVWHFSSVDWGRRYLCVGFNSLYRVHKEIDVDSYKPAGKRVWTWLVLCDDGTVVAIHENPFPGASEPLAAHQARIVEAIRRNMRNIFRQLSRGFDDSMLQNTLETIKLRSDLPTTTAGRDTDAGSKPRRRRAQSMSSSTAADDDDDDDDDDNDDDEDDEEHAPKTSNSNDPDYDRDAAPSVSESDAPSLLFYYLFDDWFTSYSLVARREHQYGVELDRLRDRMFHRAELEHVSRLHHYGRQLAVLRRIYSSYATIIQRVLDGPQTKFVSTAQAANLQAVRAARQQALMDGSALSSVGGAGWSAPGMGASSEAMAGGKSTVEIGEVQVTGEDGAKYGVEITVAASTRFRRLRDRINMYAIGEIMDCIEEKNSLMELNFNLITLKESSYIEGLTRITILLAKVTILFLPVSFVTAYFTVEFTDKASGGPIQYDLRQYWVTFAVVFAITACGLTLFGRLSGTQEGKPIYESFTSLFINGWRRFWHKRPIPDTSAPPRQLQPSGPNDIRLGGLTG